MTEQKLPPWLLAAADQRIALMQEMIPDPRLPGDEMVVTR
jgi:hypothetical protein